MLRKTVISCQGDRGESEDVDSGRTLNYPVLEVRNLRLGLWWSREKTRGLGRGKDGCGEGGGGGVIRKVEGMAKSLRRPAEGLLQN